MRLTNYSARVSLLRIDIGNTYLVSVRVNDTLKKFLKKPVNRNKYAGSLTHPGFDRGEGIHFVGYHTSKVSINSL